MNTALSLITTNTKFTTHHGKLSTVGFSQDMEIDTDGPPFADRGKGPDAMDTSLDLHHHDDKANGKEVIPNSGPEVAALQDARQIFERPREEDALPKVPNLIARQAQTSHLQQDLLSLFHLQPVAASVARTDPTTGEKINKMRKSYEGKVKNLGLAGRNRAVKHENGKGLGLLEMTRWPEEEWHNQKIAGKDVHKGLPNGILAKLEKAMQMQPGPVSNTPENDWEDLLGHEKVKPLPTIAEQNPKHAMNAEKLKTKPSAQVNGVHTPVGTDQAAEVLRPKRAGRKRRYDEHSFEGYGEGFVDDDGDLVEGSGYTSNEGGRQTTTSKKRKKSYHAVSPTFGERSGSYSTGMVGVSSGTGVYGR